MEQDIKKTMEQFDLTETQAKMWLRFNADGALYGRDSFIKECWKEAQREVLINIRGFLGTGGNTQDKNVENLLKYVTDKFEETNNNTFKEWKKLKIKNK